MTRTFGIDTSHWDGKINAKVAKAKGITFCYFKMTDFYASPSYPIGWIDSQAVNTWNATRGEGILNGGFCWLQPKQDPTVQAKFYLDAYTKFPTDMPPILDFEKQAVNSWNDFLWRAQVWLAYVEEQTNELPWVYTNQDLMSYMDKKRSAFLYRYPLIVASYRPLWWKPAMPQPWDKWTMWQYTDRAYGFDYGTQSKELDLDVFEGTEQELRDLLHVGTTPPVPVDYLFQARFKMTALAKRDKPKTGTVVGYVEAGEVVKVYEVDKVTGWYRIDGGWCSGYAGYWEVLCQSDM